MYIRLNRQGSSKWRLHQGLAVAGAVVLLLGWGLFSVSTLIVLVGLLVCGLAALSRETPTITGAADSPGLLELPFRLARDPQVFQQYQLMTESLWRMSENRDSIYREIVLEQLDALSRQATMLAGGTFTFEGTETWRIVYERLLRSPGLHLYRSVAWVKNANYWQDEPGRKSMAVNFELNDAEQLNIERIVIIADALWPPGEVWPSEITRQWLHEQHTHGLWIKFVRESSLNQETDLLTDLGIYGSRAVGIQELDEQCRTVRFTLDFDFANVTAAEERWRRLSIYAESWSGYLDRYEIHD